jgi:signal transduction histidine kinase
MIRQNTSIARIVIFFLVVVTIFVSIALVFFSYWQERNIRIKELHSELKIVSGQLSSSLALPVWNFDQQQTEKILESTMQNRQIFGIVVRESDLNKIVAGQARDAQWRVIPTMNDIRAQGLLSAQTAITIHSRQIGSVQVYLSPRFMKERLHTYLMQFVTGILALNVCMALILFQLLKRAVINPLKAVEGYALKVGAGETEKAAISGNGFYGELDNLRRSIEDMTRALLEAREQLVRREKLSILGQLAGSLGHELRNPLGVMNNAVYFLKTVLPGADDTIKEYLDIIKKEIDTSLCIITDLLDFARTKKPQAKAVAVRHLIEEALGRCIFPENISLLTTVSDTLPALKIDPLQIGQVLYNLITNAIQAMPEGGTLEIQAQELPASLGMKISIIDSGEGIPPERMEKLFQPLYTTKARGIGLGLTLCKNLCEANGGTIEVASLVGRGTTFSVTLPTEEPEEP